MKIGALLALLVLAIAIPASAAPTAEKAKPKPPAIPSCRHFSAAKMTALLGTGPLRFKDQTPHANLCNWQAKKAGHYRQTLTIEVIPGIRSIYETAEADGKKSAAKEGRSFGNPAFRSAPWKKAFFVTGEVTNGEVEPCPPGHKLPKFGPSPCTGDPPWSVTNVDSYNSKLMVSVGVGYETGDVNLDHVIALNEEILSRKIR